MDHRAALSALVFMLGCGGVEPPAPASPPAPVTASTVATSGAPASTVDAGAAPSVAQTCGGFAGAPCPPGFHCKLPDTRGADLAGTCVPGKPTPLRASDLVNPAKERSE